MLSLISFIVLIGVLITAHELGHFIVAKLANVKVHTFSVGFGRAILSKTVGETEYRIAWLPLGGYVKLDGIEKEFGELQQEAPEEGELNRELKHGTEPMEEGRALGDKPAWVRALIFIAGPAMNLLLPFALLPPIYLLSQRYDEVISPQMGVIDQGLPAYQAGFRNGDLITEINGVPIEAFWQVVDAVGAYEPTDPPLNIKALRPPLNTPVEYQVTPERIETTSMFGFTDYYNRIGFQPMSASADVAISAPEGPFAQAGGQTFDRLLSLNGEQIESLIHLEKLLHAHRDATSLSLEVERLSDLNDEWRALKRRSTLTLNVAGPSAWPASSASLVERLGVMSSMSCVSSIDPSSPAAQLLKVGDCLTAVEGQAHSLPGFIDTRLRHEPEQAKQVSFSREGVTSSGSLSLQSLTYHDPLNGDLPYWGLGFTFAGMTREGSVRPPQMLANDSQRLRFAWYQTTDFIQSELTRSLQMIGGMFSGAVSPKHLSGPVTIFYLAGQEAEAGWERFMFLMVMISMSIALVNLLPVPGLDGGHILIATIEMIIRRRLPIKVRLALQSVGVLFILSLILFALGNDALRMWRLSQGG